MSASNESLQGRLLDGRYLIGDLIARGGMASVYRATDTRLDRVVAVKVMHPGMGDDAAFTERFVREARSAAKLNHPNVVAVFDQGDDNGTLYLVMELVEGRTLRDLLREEAPLSPRRALAVLEQMLLALSAAHEAHIVHRDVKPENVLLAPDGRLKVADFGLARAVSSVTGGAANPTTGVLIGTVSYLAPELVLKQGSDARTDVYACGAVLYEMLTGFKPHSGDTPIQVAYRHVHEDVPPPSARIQGIPPYIDALVARATARDRDRRSADARVLLRQVRQVRHALDRGLPNDPELVADLLPTVDRGTAQPPAPAPTVAQQAEPTLVVGSQGPPPTASPQPPAPEPAPRKRRRGLIWLLIIVILAVLAAIGGFYFGVMRYSTTPDLTGETEKTARQIVESRGLDLTVAHEKYSETVPEGTVMDTEPEAGDNIIDGGTVDVTLSMGKERYAVPKLAGKSEDAARDALAEAHLTAGEPIPQYSARVDSGDVIRGSIKPGKLVKPDTTVDLIVSKGRRPIDVASQVGKPVAEARAALTQAGFRIDIERTRDRDVPRGYVITQSPNNGSAYRGDTIRLVVSRGPARVEVPDVRFMRVDDATDELESHGFKVEVEEDDISVGAGIVRDQDPPGGERARRGSTVTLYVV
ncbi:Stk1 family PASTA domain-containing Ser/Thr kinase [Solicola gregarius]|uniref:non-specific serine/threonine protein kinase n=1 Tax=Solicola gregarius TaxID=2908642 RepID=A0AA46THS2_9ACTN|nr:Stk1 family PASTA domain-containing Ser/Thr kinase [Solicola gregarius]UYM05375.1 Stk1 family PASTA domain-containing Ser/Thr kinase [Solicola gregarius]